MLRLILCLSFGSLLLVADSVNAQDRLPQPPSNKDILKGLQKATNPYVSSGETMVQAGHQAEQVDEKLPPPKPVKQASFSAPPMIAKPLVPAGDFSDDDPAEESFREERDDNESNTVLDKPLSSKKNAKEKGKAIEGEKTDGEKTEGGWMNKLAKPDLTPFVSIGGSLLIVIAAFFLLAILFRKVAPKGSQPLPKEAFECLGRYYLTQKHQLQVLRLGNRIVLVSVMPEGVTTLAEITDPDETVQFLGLCRRLDSNSATEVFRKAVANMSEDELSRPHHRPAVTTRRREQPASSLDLYSDPDESLASLLARGKPYGR
ncbi:MAG: flagellar biosynthetic protein FliO [Planctomycetaceae bacterium]|nr:flagellar biosynthetic protein FliO [Planctomycetaceae bacterium]